MACRGGSGGNGGARRHQSCLAIEFLKILNWKEYLRSAFSVSFLFLLIWLELELWIFVRGSELEGIYI